MKFSSRFLAFFFASTVLGVANASDGTGFPMHGDGYVSVTYSQGDIATIGDSGGLGLKPALEDAGAKLTVGYRLADGVHIEAALSNMRYSPQQRGVVDYSTVISTQTSSLSTLFSLPTAAGLKPFVKVGMAAVAVGLGREFTTTSVAAFGFVFPLSGHVDARVEIERLDRFGVGGRDFTQAFIGLQARL